ncbi:hypothetical protein NUSPORA_00709 [Nucleospora cyclopteri]
MSKKIKQNNVLIYVITIYIYLEKAFLLLKIIQYMPTTENIIFASEGRNENDTHTDPYNRNQMFDYFLEDFYTKNEYTILDFIFVPKITDETVEFSNNFLPLIILLLKNNSDNIKSKNEMTILDSFYVYKSVHHIEIHEKNIYCRYFDEKYSHLDFSNLTCLQQTVSCHFSLKNTNLIDEFDKFLKFFNRVINLAFKNECLKLKEKFVLFLKIEQHYIYFKDKYVKWIEQIYPSGNIKSENCKITKELAEQCIYTFCNYKNKKIELGYHLTYLRTLLCFENYINLSKDFLIDKLSKAIEIYEKHRLSKDVLSCDLKNKVIEEEILIQENIINNLIKTNKEKSVKVLEMAYNIRVARRILEKITSETNEKLNNLLHSQIKLIYMQSNNNLNRSFNFERTKLNIQNSFTMYKNTKKLQTKAENCFIQEYLNYFNYIKNEENIMAQHQYNESLYLEYLKDKISFIDLFKYILSKNLLLEINLNESRIIIRTKLLHDKIIDCIYLVYKNINKILHEESIRKKIIREDFKIIEKLKNKSFLYEDFVFKEFLSNQEKRKLEIFNIVCDIVVDELEIQKRISEISIISCQLYNEYKFKLMCYHFIKLIYSSQNEIINNTVIEIGKKINYLFYKSGDIIYTFYKNFFNLLFFRLSLKKAQKKIEIQRLQSTIEFCNFHILSKSPETIEDFHFFKNLVRKEKIKLDEAKKGYSKLTQNFLMIDEKFQKNINFYFKQKENYNKTLMTLKIEKSSDNNFLKLLQEKYNELVETINYVKTTAFEYEQTQDSFLNNIKQIKNQGKFLQKEFFNILTEIKYYESHIKKKTKVITIVESMKIIKILRNYFLDIFMQYCNCIKDLFADEQIFIKGKEFHYFINKLRNIKNSIRNIENTFRIVEQLQTVYICIFDLNKIPVEIYDSNSKLLKKTICMRENYMFYRFDIYQFKIIILETISLIELVSKIFQDFRSNCREKESEIYLIDEVNIKLAQENVDNLVIFLFKLRSLHQDQEFNIKKAKKEFDCAKKLMDIQFKEITEEFKPEKKKKHIVYEMPGEPDYKKKYRMYSVLLGSFFFLFIISIIIILFVITRIYEIKKL